ncbi:MAG: hypothetical protein Q9170_000671 [Blastenia crenularia]
MFLQASAKLSTCFSHIGIALRSAIRLGLHRCVSNQFSPVEQEIRKRIFWVIRNMDIYVGALLGLPMMLNDEDIDQDFPLEVDDAYITTDAVLPMPPGKTSLMSAFVAHIRLVRLLGKTVRYVYPLQTSRTRSNDAYAVSYAKIREVEQDLHQWMEDLPMALRPGGNAPPELVRVQQLLRIAYGHIQVMLYRPFLHYASTVVHTRKVDKRSYACAAACVSVSRNITHITSEMKKRGLLTGAYWFTMYTTFFAVLSLLFYVIENPHNAASHGILKDAHEGRDTLASLASRSMAADRSSQTLKASMRFVLFDQLPEAVRLGRLSSVSQKKRSAPTENALQPHLATSSNLSASRSNAHSPTDWSNTSSGLDDGDWKRPQRIFGSPTVLGPSSATFESSPIGNPQQTFRNSPTSNITFQPYSMASRSVPASTSQSIFSAPETTGSGDTPDLTTMMFPSNDPFAYPNQPMTTLENFQANNQDGSANSQMFLNGTNNDSYNDISPSFYSSLPPFSAQGTNSTADLSGDQVDGESRDFDGSQTWAQQPQMRFGGPSAGPGWDAVYGEDWSGGWTDQGYGQ